MENSAALRGHPCAMPLRLVKECVSPLLVVRLLVVTVLYHTIAVWYMDGARRRVFVSSVCAL
eukprot:6316762-Prorocentrum_lima.AAC.1